MNGKIKTNKMNINLETLIERVQKHLNEEDTSYVQSVYKLHLKLRINRKSGGDLLDVLNEIRGVTGVTTVNHEAEYSRKTDSFLFGLFSLKFELVGRESNPKDYITKVLIPGIREIKGVDIQDIQKNPEKLS
jgi:translation elongation factor EF-1beta